MCTASASLGITAQCRPTTRISAGRPAARRSGWGSSETWFVVEQTLSYIGGVSSGREAGRSAGRADPDRAGLGPGGDRGFSRSLFSLAAVLSVSIGLLNLFPVPLLDGGHLMFYAIEAVRGRPLSERAQEMGFRVGLALVLMLMIFATYNDILHLAVAMDGDRDVA